MLLVGQKSFVNLKLHVLEFGFQKCSFPGAFLLFWAWPNFITNSVKREMWNSKGQKWAFSTLKKIACISKPNFFPVSSFIFAIVWHYVAFGQWANPFPLLSCKKGNGWIFCWLLPTLGIASFEKQMSRVFFLFSTCVACHKNVLEIFFCFRVQKPQ